MRIRRAPISGFILAVLLAMNIQVSSLAAGAPEMNAEGMLAIRAGEYEKAFGLFTAAIEADPSYARAYNNRAYVLTLSGRYEEAAVEVERAMAIGPEEAAFYDTHGVAMAGRGLHQEAMADYRHALRLDGSLAEVYLHRGQLCEALGRWNGALEDYSDYLRYAKTPSNDPDRLSVMRRLTEINQMLPEVIMADTGKLTASVELSAGAPDGVGTVEWAGDERTLMLRHGLKLPAGGTLNVKPASMRRFADFTLIELMEQATGRGTADTPATARITLSVPENGWYVLRVYRYGPDGLPQIVAEGEVRVGSGPGSGRNGF